MLFLHITHKTILKRFCTPLFYFITLEVQYAAQLLWFNYVGINVLLCILWVALQVELEDPVENIGASLVRQAASKTNDLAGDGTTTSVVLAQGLIAEGVKVCKKLLSFCKLFRGYDGVMIDVASLMLVIQVVAAGANPIQITRGIERTTKALVAELKKMSKEVKIMQIYVKVH